MNTKTSKIGKVNAGFALHLIHASDKTTDTFTSKHSKARQLRKIAAKKKRNKK